MKKNAIKTCILTGSFTVISCLTLSFITNSILKKQIEKNTENIILTSLQDIQDDIDAFNTSNFSIIHMMSSLPYLKDKTHTLREIDDQIFEIRKGNPSIIGLNITDLQGNSWTDKKFLNFSERPYFKNALLGKETVYGPIVNKVSNMSTIFYGSPHYDYEGNLINTFFLASHGENLSSICEKHENLYPKLKYAIVRRSTGLIIASSDIEVVMKDNIFDDVADSSTKELSDMTMLIADGKTGYKKIKAPEGYIVNGYAPIANTDWSVIIKGDWKDFSSDLTKTKIILLCFTLIMTLCSVLVSLLVRSKD